MACSAENGGRIIARGIKRIACVLGVSGTLYKRAVSLPIVPLHVEAGPDLIVSSRICQDRCAHALGLLGCTSSSVGQVTPYILL